MSLDATLTRARPLSALIIGATGINVLRIVTAFERKRIVTVRADDIASACERVVVEMPHVVLALVSPADDAERETFADRALAVGALVVHLNPHLDDDTFQHILEHTVQATLERKRLREAAEVQAHAVGASDTLPSEDFDDDWHE